MLKIFFFLTFLTCAFATVCQKSFGQYVGQQAYDCCIYLGGKPSVSLVGCSYGQCRNLSCDLPEENAQKYDCYAGPGGSMSNCTTIKTMLNTCTKEQFNKGYPCPSTKSTKYM